MPPDFYPLLTSGFFLGMGMGAILIDGALLHQMLQLHNMVSGWVYPDTIENIRINMFYDGVFHTLAWLMIAVGIFLLWNALGQKNVPRSPRALFGSMIFGFGCFSLVEAIIDHHMLGIHHVVESAPEPTKFYYDIMFLLLTGPLNIAIGGFHIYRAQLDLDKI